MRKYMEGEEAQSRRGIKRKRIEKERRPEKKVMKKEIKENKNKVIQALSFRGIQGEEKKTQKTEKAKEGRRDDRMSNTDVSPNGEQSRDIQDCKDAWKLVMGRARANQVPPHYPEVRSGSAKLSRKGKVAKSNYTLIRNKWGLIELSKLNKPCAKIKSRNNSNYKDKHNKGNLRDEREKLLVRGAPDENKDLSSSKPSESKGYPKVTEEVSDIFDRDT